MLKIKDSVDLKELEKFGFKFYEKDDTYYVGNYPYTTSIYIDSGRNVVFDDEWFGDYHFSLMDYLFDLIKADLVEKVKE